MDTYEKKYNEALERARNLYPSVHEHNKKMLEQIFPELRESEDEKIRNEIIDYLHLVGKGDGDYAQPMIDRWIAWLGQQECGEKGLKGPQEIGDWRGDEGVCKKQKEQKPSFGIYWHKIKKGEKLPCRAYVWNLDYEKYHDCFEGRLIANLENISVGGDTWYLPVDDVRNLPREGVDELPREQKHAEKQDYPGLTDLERAIHRGFLSAGVENVPVTIIKETANECKRTQTIANENANAEWNEEDKSFYDSIMCEVVKEGMHPTPAQANWFKLLPERFNLKPHRKPSKEQEKPKYYQHFDPDC